ncbi:MAG: ethanolamine ammonia-lyase subunit EutC [Desulfuromusa sp.]|nr:ethanolamine ammonia-lyase subunit EutC [Desulfuromusa sp.]
MLDMESKIKNLIADVLSEMGVDSSPSAGEIATPQLEVSLPDLTAENLSEQLLVPTPVNREAYLKFKQATVSRIGIWRTGSRYLTRSLLRFRADHAIAQDAVFNEVSAEFIKDWGLAEIKTKCCDKDQFLTRPDLGRELDDENTALLKKSCPGKARVQVYIADGLSSSAVEKNAKDTFLALIQGLKGHGIEAGTPFFLRYGRVPAMDAVAEILQPEVTVVLIGERPGLATAESMSCYMAYNASVGMPEARRTVLSNIHKGGLPAVEAGAHIADVVKKILDQKVSGLDLKK